MPLPEPRPAVSSATILAGIRDGVLVVDREWRIVFVNAAAVALFDLPAGDLAGRPLWQAAPAAVATALRGAAVAALAAGQPARVDRFLAEQRRWLEIDLYPHAEGLSLLTRDVTEQQQRAAAEHDQRDLLALALDLGELGAWSWAIDSDIVTWNDADPGRFGLPAAATLADMLAAIHPADRERVAVALAQARDTGQYEAEFRVTGPDGDERWLAGRGRAVRDAEGRSLRIVSVVSDITARQRGEAARRERDSRYEAVAQIAPVGIYWTDAAGRCQYVNARLTAMTGLAAEALYGLGWADALHADDRERVLAAWTRAQASGQPFLEDFRFVRPDGSVLWVESQATAARDASGRLLGYVGALTDVTARRASEAALRASEERYRLLFDASPRPMWVYDEQTLAFLAVNDAALEMYGYSRAEFLARRITDLRTPEDVPALLTMVASDQGARRRVTLARHRRADGRVRDVEIVSHALAIDGRPARLAIATDVTEQRQAEETRAWLAAIVDSSEDAIMGRDRTGRITSWNRGAERLFGYPAAEVLGRPSTLLAPPELTAEVAALSERLVAGERIPYLETRRRRRDGLIIDVALSAAPITAPSGAVVGTAVIFRDISDRKAVEAALRASEERTRRLIATANEGIWLVDADGQTVLTNHRMAVLLGVDSTTITGATPADFCFPDDAWSAREHIGRNLAGETEVFDFRFRRADGGEVLVLACTSPVQDADGKIVGALGMFTDITARKQAEAERERLLVEEQVARAAAEAAVRLRDHVVATVTHDLKSPLATMRGFAQVLLRQATRPDPPLDKFVTGLTHIDQASTKMARMLDDLLDTARIQLGQPLTLQPRPTDLVALVEGCVAEYDHQREHCGLVIERRVDGLVGDWDAGRLERVVDNLLSNAVKYSPDGGDVIVTLDRDRQDGRSWAVLGVRDQGMGIPADELARIFEPFQRARNVADRFPGIGIGLAGAKQIVEQHGGALTVTSTEGAGSCFTVRLPLADEERLDEQR